jgi:hypothetical protein
VTHLHKSKVLPLPKHVHVLLLLMRVAIYKTLLHHAQSDLLESRMEVTNCNPRNCNQASIMNLCTYIYLSKEQLSLDTELLV